MPWRRNISSEALPITPYFTFLGNCGDNWKKHSMAFLLLKKTQSTRFRIKGSSLLIIGKILIKERSSNWI